DERDLPRHQALQHRRFALDDELAPALELTEPGEAPLHVKLVAALQDGLPRRHELRSAAALEREHDQAGGRADPALGEALADEDGVVSDPHLEVARLETVLHAQVSLTSPLRLVLELAARQQMPAEQRHEENTRDHERAAER